MKRIFFFLECAALLGLASAMAWGQATTSLRGTVRDPSGAIIPAARVTINNPNTGYTRTVMSGPDGVYEFLQILPGHYQIKVSKDGFKDFVRTGIELLVSSAATLNVTLQVGSTTQTVTITGTAPLLNTSNATLGNGFNENQVKQLPIESRNVVDLLSIQPGVTYLGDRPDFDVNEDTRSGAVNGTRSDQSNVTLDGIDVNDYNAGFAFTSVLEMTPDSLEEFKLTTTDSGANQGHSAGAEVSLVTKSGTNQFHGVLYEYNRDTALAANDYFIKLSQLQQGQPDQAPKLIRNIFGGTFGGPIKKDRAFFFVSYDQRDDEEGESTVREIPSATLRQGIVQYPNVNGGVTMLSPAQITAMDPLGIGPSKAMMKYFQTYPMPNDTSVGDGYNFSGYRFASNVDSYYHTGVARLDLRLNSSGTQNLFWRGNWMDDNVPYLQFLPDAGPEYTNPTHSNGFGVGWIANLGPTIVNSAHFGLTRESVATIGDINEPYIEVRNLDQGGFYYSHGFTMPVYDTGDDLTWAKGTHTLEFGGDWLFIHNPRTSSENSWSYALMNASWLNPSGIANTGTYFDPAVNGYPAVAQGFDNSYDYPLIGLLGMVTEVNAIYNYTKTGAVLSQGTPITRDFDAQQYALYGQDSWRLRPDLTLNFGLRYEISPAPYEANGLQVAPNVNMTQWFNNRAKEMLTSQPSFDDQLLQFKLAGPANNGPGFYATDYGNWAPRFSFAYSPRPTSGFLEHVFGAGGKTAIRGGFGIAYYHFGEEMLNTFDQNGSFGLASQIDNPAGVQTENCAPRVTSLNVIPVNGCGGAIYVPAPPGGFPATPPTNLNDGGFSISWGMDNTMPTPYVYQVNFTIERELAHDWVLQSSYVGDFGHRLPSQEDLAQPLNFVDPQSKTSYYAAASRLSELGDQGVTVAQITPQMVGKTANYWGDIFPSIAGFNNPNGVCGSTVPNCTPLQAVYDVWLSYLHNESSALQVLDLPGYACTNGCSRFGPYTFYNQQYSSLYAWRNVGYSNFNALEATLRKRFSQHLQADFNWTWSRSMDISSDAERIIPYGGFDGQITNAWDPYQLYGPSDYNLTNQINSDWVWELPFGRGRFLAGQAHGIEEALIGGWQGAGIFRWTTGFPYIVDNGAEYPTDFQLEGLATQVGPLPKSGVYKFPDGAVSIFQNPTAAFNSWNFTLPGFSGTRNVGNGGGFFGLDLSLAKRWTMPWSEKQSLQFRIEGFNITNTPSFDVHNNSNNEIDEESSFGRYTNLLTNPREFQLALRYEF
jgi:hypothetical protein